MRLLMTADTVGGVWSYSLELARALAPVGVEVCLATMGAPASEEQRLEASRLPNLRLYESKYRLEWMKDPWEDVGDAGGWLLGLEAEVRPDIIHLNGYAHGSLPFQAPRLVVGHSCVCSWWESVLHDEAPASYDRYREAVRRGLQEAELVVTPTQAMAEALERHYGPLRAIRVIPNGRDPALFPPAAKEPFVFCAGRLWDEAKNATALAAVAGDLAWPVYVAGDDRHPEGVRPALEQVRLLGRLSPAEVAGWLGRAAIYALPARYEPFGLSALEAAFAGCALVLGDIPSLREVWADAALFVDPEDPQALRTALQRLIEDPAARAQMAEKARSRAFMYTPERMGAGYRAAYRYLLGRRDIVSRGEAPAGVGVLGGAAVALEREEEEACAW